MNVDFIHFHFSLLSYSLEFNYRLTETYLVSFNFFNPWWRRRSKLPYSCEFFKDLFFVSIYCDNFILCIIEHRTMLPWYCPIFNFYLSHSEIEYSLLLVLKGWFLWYIVCFINTSFHIHFSYFSSWKQNITFINPNCSRWSAGLFDMNLVKEYKLGGCQWRKLVLS